MGQLCKDMIIDFICSFSMHHLQVPEISYDFVDDDNDPSNGFPSHGTACGGIVGSLKEGAICGVGIAHEVNLGGK